MHLPPIIERELRVAQRGKLAVRGRWISGLIVGLLTCLFIFTSRHPREAGHRLFEFLLLVGCFTAVIHPPNISADAFSRERRNNTLGLLFLTGMSSMEMFMSKLLAAALIAFNYLLAIIPFFSIPFLLGGVSFAQFLGAVVFLPNLLFFTLSVSLLASVFCKEESAALLLTVALGALICFGLPALYYGGKLFAGAPGIPSEWLLLSPAYGPFMVHRAFQIGSPAEFWINSAITLAWSITALIVAAWVLTRTWRDSITFSNHATWRERFQEWRSGSPAWRLALRRRWLDDTPFVWLAACDRGPATVGYAALLGISGVWTLCWLAWPKGWISIGTSFTSAILMNGTLVWIISYAAGKRIGEDRSNGALELLLTTPLFVEEILEGQRLALIVQFKQLLKFALLLNLALLGAGLTTQSWSHESLCVYFLAWGLILIWTWTALKLSALRTVWISLNLGRPTSAISVRPSGGTSQWWLLWVVFVLFNGSGWRMLFSGFPKGSLFELILLGGFVIGSLLWLRWSHEPEKKLNQIREDFRIIARSPLPEPTDPRLKNWDRNRRFPLTRYDFDPVRRQ